MSKHNLTIKIEAKDLAEAEVRASYLREINEHLSINNFEKIIALMRNPIKRLFLFNKLNNKDA